MHFAVFFYFCPQFFRAQHGHRASSWVAFADKLVFRRPRGAHAVVALGGVRTRCCTPPTFVVFHDLSRGSRTVGLASNIESENLISFRRIEKVQQNKAGPGLFCAKLLDPTAVAPTWGAFLVGSGRRLLVAGEGPKDAGRLGSPHVLHQGACRATLERVSARSTRAYGDYRKSTRQQ